MKLTLFLFALVLITATSSAYEEGWHDSAKCDPCHNTILPETQSDELMDGCGCHYITPGSEWTTKVDIEIVKTLHSVETCMKCHLNSKASLTEENIHRLHTGIDCELCHGDSTVTRPDILRCDSCHGSNIHGTHKEKLDEACEACHGEYGKDATLTYSDDLLSKGFTEKCREIPTIIDVLRFILNPEKL